MKPGEKRQRSHRKITQIGKNRRQGANGQKESDSQGDQGGDKAGGGEEGGGQKAPREGTGSAGQHQSADDGAGESGEKGKGNTSPNAGRDSKSDHKTGSSSGDSPGQGSKQKDGAGGTRRAGRPGGEGTPRLAVGRTPRMERARRSRERGAAKCGEREVRQGEREDREEKGSDAQKGKAGSNQESGGGKSGGGGEPGTAINPSPTITGAAPEGDAANLEYARKQTDLVLDKLSDQLNRNKVDDRLLKELGWSREDLRRFVARWQQRKEAAQREDPSGDMAKRELDDALRSLGLHHDRLQQAAAKKDTLRDLREGYRGPVPLEYQERLRAYNQGVSRAGADEGSPLPEGGGVWGLGGGAFFFCAGADAKVMPCDVPRYLVPFHPKRIPHHFVDVLIIGGGIAGLRAAMEIDPRLSLLVITKDTMEQSNSAYAQGGIASVIDPEDNFASHVDDTLVAGANLCDPRSGRDGGPRGAATHPPADRMGHQLRYGKRRTDAGPRRRA